MCHLGLAVQALQLGPPGVFAHDMLGSVVDRDFHLCVGVRIAGGVRVIALFHLRTRILPALRLRELHSLDDDDVFYLLQ